MAADGFLPRALAAREGRPPVWSVILQAAVALIILLTHSLQQILTNVGAILTLFAAMTSFAIFRVRFSSSRLERPSGLAMAAAFIHVASAVLMLYFGFRGSTHLLLWLGVVAVFALAAYATTAAVRATHRRQSAVDY